MKNFSKSIVSCISATVAIGISGVVSYPAHAESTAPQSVSSVSPTLGSFSANSNETGEAYANLVDTLKHEFTFDRDGNLALKSSMRDLAKKYSLTDVEVSQLDTLLNTANTSTGSVAQSISTAPRAVVAGDRGDGARILYIDNATLTTGTASMLFAAAQVSPAALMAAWTAFTATFSGPIAIGSAVLGSLFFADLAMKIVGAGVEGRGIAFYADWGIPPLTAKIE